jgi:hypothetical protein
MKSDAKTVVIGAAVAGTSVDDDVARYERSRRAGRGAKRKRGA